MRNHSTYRALPKINNHRCFGCSPINPYGLRMKFYTNETSVFSSITVPEHMCGWNKLVHGGILSVILDEIMSWTALHILKKIVLTKSITIDFLKPVSIKDELKAEGKSIKTIGRHEALVEGLIYNPKGDVCVKSTGRFVLLSPKVATRLGIVNEEALKGIEKNPGASHRDKTETLRHWRAPFFPALREKKATRYAGGSLPKASAYEQVFEIPAVETKHPDSPSQKRRRFGGFREFVKPSLGPARFQQP